ncbi:hypothetical protein [Acinetobacter albensis]|uniref:DUF1705 domain-containing protein n=1 Tax=Acinetobacter albensis TaxID=1673609 RepID=A0A1C4GWR5_9GAMM|nr:hypothetical protein [Acinetobacter albensis]SCC72636.1 hypothetical protein GA0116959_11142 [Acinetobacter albensis]
MHKNISGTIFYSLLFAMGGTPTIAMLIIQAQTQDPKIIYSAFIGLTVILACILVPVILIQNAILFFKRKNEQLEQKIKPLCQVYLVLNAFCLIYWLIFQFLN